MPLLLANEPPAPPSDHTAEVAPPPNEPPNTPLVAPWQIAATAPPALTVGNGFTVTVLVAVFTHPFTSVPVTVYVVVEVALKAVASVIPPVQEYELAPVPLNVTIVPEHTVAPGLTVELTVGFGFTITILAVVIVPHEPPAVVKYKNRCIGPPDAAV